MRKKVQLKQYNIFITFFTESLKAWKNQSRSLNITIKDRTPLWLSDLSPMPWPDPHTSHCCLTAPGFPAEAAQSQLDWHSFNTQHPQKDR